MLKRALCIPLERNRLKMAAYRIAYAALLVAALAFSQIYSGHLSSVLLITVLALPFASLFMAVIGRFALKLSFDCNPVTVERGTEIKLQLTAKNMFVFPCSTLFVTASMPDIEDKRKAKLVFSLGILQKKQLNFVYPSNFRGEYEISVDKAYIFDILKLFKLTKSFDLKKYVLVIPRVYDTFGGSDYSLSTDEETVIQTSDFTGGERSFVRKYNNGDDIRKIHWKLSSKQEDYVVWQEVKNRFKDAVVFCDTAEYSDDKVINAKNTDSVLEIAIAACLHNIRQGRDCIFAYYSKEHEQTHFIPVTAMEDLYRAVRAAAAIKSYKGSPEFSYEAKKLFSQNESVKGTLLITCDSSEKIVQLSKDISAFSEFSLILAGKASKSTKDSIKALKRVRFVSVERENIELEISNVISQIY